jgi:hypothetical protein
MKSLIILLFLSIFFLQNFICFPFQSSSLEAFIKTKQSAHFYFNEPYIFNFVAKFEYFFVVFHQILYPSASIRGQTQTLVLGNMRQMFYRCVTVTAHSSKFTSLLFSFTIFSMPVSPGLARLEPLTMG